MIPFVLLLTTNAVVLTVWTIVNPLKYTRLSHTGTDEWNRVLSTYGICQSDDPAFPYYITLGVINLSIVLLANYQAYRTHFIRSEFSESKYIGLVMISMLQAFMSGVPILFLVRETPGAYYLILVFMIFFICMAVLWLIFLPKVLIAKKLEDESVSQRRLRLRQSIRQSQSVSFRALFQQSQWATSWRNELSDDDNLLREAKPNAKPNHSSEDDTTSHGMADSMYKQDPMILETDKHSRGNHRDSDGLKITEHRWIPWNEVQNKTTAKKNADRSGPDGAAVDAS
jgi:hypothetical protein